MKNIISKYFVVILMENLLLNKFFIANGLGFVFTLFFLIPLIETGEFKQIIIDFWTEWMNTAPKTTNEWNNPIEITHSSQWNVFMENVVGYLTRIKFHNENRIVFEADLLYL